MIKLEKTRKNPKKWRLVSLAAKGGTADAFQGGGWGVPPLPPIWRTLVICNSMSSTTASRYHHQASSYSTLCKCKCLEHKLNATYRTVLFILWQSVHNEHYRITTCTTWTNCTISNFIKLIVNYGDQLNSIKLNRLHILIKDICFSMEHNTK